MADNFNNEEFYRKVAEYLDHLTTYDPDIVENLKKGLTNEESILKEIKKYLGIHPDDHTFDIELRMLYRSGIQKIHEMTTNDNASDVSNPPELSDDYIVDEFDVGFAKLSSVCKEWLYLYIKLSFDPPTASTLTYLKERLHELEWYIVNYNLGDLIYDKNGQSNNNPSWD